MSHESREATPEQYRRVWDIHRTLIPKPEDLISTNRFFVREGPVNMYSEKERKKKPYYLFLFNDVMLICKKQPKQKWRVKIYVTLRSTYVHTENIPAAGFDSQFRLHCKARSFNFYCTSDEDRECWLKELNTSINGEHANEHHDKDYQKKQRELEGTTTPSAVPPSDLAPTRKRSASEEKVDRKPNGSVPTKAASSRTGRTRAESSMPPGETNPRSKATPPKQRTNKAYRSTTTNIGDPSQWDPYGANALKPTTAHAPTLIQSSPGMLAGIGSTPAANASPFDSFLISSQPGYQTNTNFSATPRPASTLFTSNPNVFTNNPVQHRSTVNFGNAAPFFASDGGSSPQNYRATVNFGAPSTGGGITANTANPFMTNPNTIPAFGSGAGGAVSAGAPFGGSSAGGGGGAPFGASSAGGASGANPFSPRASLNFGTANPFMTNGGTATANPFLTQAPTGSPPFASF